MNTLIFFGLFNILLGITMVIFRKIIGPYFCKIGRKISEKCPIEDARHMAEFTFNEKDSPKSFFILGIVLICQGPIFLIIACF